MFKVLVLFFILIFVHGSMNEVHCGKNYNCAFMAKTIKGQPRWFDRELPMSLPHLELVTCTVCITIHNTAYLLGPVSDKNISQVKGFCAFPEDDDWNAGENIVYHVVTHYVGCYKPFRARFLTVEDLVMNGTAGAKEILGFVERGQAMIHPSMLQFMVMDVAEEVHNIGEQLD